MQCYAASKSESTYGIMGPLREKALHGMMHRCYTVICSSITTKEAIFFPPELSKT